MKMIVPIFAGVVFLTALTVVFGWMLDIDILKRILPGFVTMKFSTSLSFLFSAIILFFSWRRELPTQSDWADVMLPSASLLLSLLMGIALLSVLFGFDSGIERLFVEDKSDALLTTVPGRPSIGTMLAFVAISILGILAIGVGRARLKLFTWLGGFVSLLGMIALVGYIIRMPWLYYRFQGFSTAMAIHTAVLFVFLGVGFMLLSLKQSDSDRSINLESPS